ncbi:MAG: periplasmic heavy metal sensor [Acidobacteria bacterium]|nr:periplasmic heavy metal sensor [Acidobacteriota bacterium]
MGTKRIGVMNITKSFFIWLSLAAILLGPLLFGVKASSGSAYASQRQAGQLKPRRRNLERQDVRQLSPPVRQEGEQPMPPPEGVRPGAPNRLQLLQRLGLTRAQWQRARQLHRKLGPKTQQLHDELEERVDAFNQALFSEAYDPRVVEQRLQEVLEKQREVMLAQVEMETAFRDILTPEQLQKFRELQARQLEIRRLQREIRSKQRQLNEELQFEPR